MNTQLNADNDFPFSFDLDDCEESGEEKVSTTSTDKPSEKSRTRTSPRSKVIDEVLSLIDDCLSTGEDLETLKGKVSALKGNNIVGLKHYVGVRADGRREQFKLLNHLPNRKTHPDYVCVVGPLPYKGVAAYITENGARATDAVVFGTYNHE